MKLSIRLVCTAIIAFAGGSLSAQFTPGSSDVPGLEQALRKLFSKVDGFTSSTVMNIQGGGQNVTLTAEMCMLNGDSRTEVDLAKMKGIELPPDMLKQLKAVGMDRVVTLSYARDGRALMIYPGMKAYAEVVPTVAAADRKSNEPTIEKTVIGVEDVAGTACEKSTVKIKGDGIPELLLTVWSSKGPKELPVKIATKQNEVSLTMEFHDFKETKPDAKLFAAPEDYKKYSSVQEMMTSNMQKLMQAAPAK